jgi:hypothetical protein
MKKLNYLFLLISLVVLSCSKDSESPAPTESPNTTKYSVVGVWKVTSAVLNGQEKIGGVNPVGSEYYFIYPNGNLGTESYSDANSTNLLGYSLGNYSLPSISSINTSAIAYNASGNSIGEYNITCDVIKINANELHIKFLNYPTASDNYVKKLIKTSIALP